MSTDEMIEQMRVERDAAFLALDEAAIRAYAEKYKIKVPATGEAFWAGVHKARAGITSLPREVRLASKSWLEERGFQLAPGTSL